MSWIQIRFNITESEVEPLENAMLEIGSCAVTLNDAADTPVFEPIRGTTPLWQDIQLIALFEADADTDIILHFTKDRLGLTSIDDLPDFKIEIVEDKDWVREWMDQFHPIQFGEKFWIVPSWRDIPDANAVNLILDPGLAFGTGTHPTTALCSKWLDSIDLKGKTVVDYGCGSGILGIAALLLGAQHMWGVDIDPQAIDATRQNAERNKVQAKDYEVFLPKQFPPVRCDVLIANILAAPLIDLAADMCALLLPDGEIALSGILRHQADEVATAFSQWIDFDEPVFEEDWTRLNGIKRQG